MGKKSGDKPTTPPRPPREAILDGNHEWWLTKPPTQWWLNHPFRDDLPACWRTYEPERLLEEEPVAKVPKTWLTDELLRMKNAGELVGSNSRIADILVPRMAEALFRGEVTRALTKGRIRNMIPELR
jgi:hypothetical protein